MQPASPRNWRVRRAYDRVQPVSSRCSRPGLRSSAGTGRRTPTRRCAARRLGTRNSPGGRNPPRRNGTPDTRSFANAAHRPAPRTADRQGSRQPRDIGPRRGGSGDLLRIVRSARKVVGLPRQDSERPAPIAGAGRRVVWVRRRRLPPAGRNRGTGPPDATRHIGVVQASVMGDCPDAVEHRQQFRPAVVAAGVRGDR
jgi:hypothetical protein